MQIDVGNNQIVVFAINTFDLKNKITIFSIFSNGIIIVSFNIIETEHGDSYNISITMVIIRGEKSHNVLKAASKNEAY